MQHAGTGGSHGLQQRPSRPEPPWVHTHLCAALPSCHLIAVHWPGEQASWLRNQGPEGPGVGVHNLQPYSSAGLSLLGPVPWVLVVLPAEPRLPTLTAPRSCWAASQWCPRPPRPSPPSSCSQWCAQLGWFKALDCWFDAGAGRASSIRTWDGCSQVLCSGHCPNWSVTPSPHHPFSAVLLLQVLTGGFFALQLPAWVAWLKWLSYIYYALQARGRRLRHGRVGSRCGRLFQGCERQQPRRCVLPGVALLPLSQFSRLPFTV